MILVTGANGFIGSALIRRLAQLNPGNVRAAARSGTAAPAGIETVVVPAIDGETDWTIALSGVEAVVHTAARVHVMREKSSTPDADYRRVNVDGTLNLARQAAAAGVKRFVFLSSIKVNGEKTDEGRPFTPDDVPKPGDPYGVSKLEAERGLRDIGFESRMEIVIIRPVLVYGPGVKGNFRTLLKVVQKGIPLPLAAFRNKRSLVGLSNLVDMIVTCISHPAAAGEIFLVSDGDDLSTPGLLRRTAVAFNRPARLFPVPVVLLRVLAGAAGKGDAIHRLADSLQVDIRKNRDLLGWTPPTSVDAELSMIAESSRKV